MRTWTIPDQWDQISPTELSQVVNWQFATGTVNNTVNGYLFDVLGGDGALLNGTIDAYDGMYYAAVNGTMYSNGGMPVLQLEGGRLLVLAPATVGALRVQRMWWVAPDGDSVARGSLVVHNPSGGGVSATVRIYGNLGSDEATVTVATSNGNAVIEGTDFWAITDDADGSGDPTLVHVVDDTTGPDAFSLSVDNLEWTYPAQTVPADDSLLWTFFAGQAPNRAAAMAIVHRARLTGQFVSSPPFSQPQNTAAWAPAWSSRSQTFAMTYAVMVAPDNHPYDINLVGNGQLENGLSDAYDGMYYLDIGSTRVSYGGSFGLTRYSSTSSYVMPAVTVGGLFVQRRYYVSTGAGTGFIRFYNLFGNPALSSVSPNITMSGNLGSDEATVVFATSDGDTIVEPGDSWYGTDDADGSGDPSLAHVTRRNPAAGMVTEPVDVASLSGDDLSWTYNAVTLAANSQGALMMFGVQAANRFTAATRAFGLHDLMGEATSGLSAAEVAMALNFSNAGLPNGAPCSMGSQCVSSFCVDGVCCNSACGGGSTTDCQACSTRAGAATDGVCSPLSAAVAPTVTCRPSAGPCDVAEICVAGSTSCPADGFAAAGTTCRPAMGVCDVSEACTGTGPACPADGFAPAGMTCRPAMGVCDVEEVCDGSSVDCPADRVAAAGTVCRPAVDVCDVEERCDGVTSACPTDAVAPAGTMCRPGGDACNPAERCDGTGTACPADMRLPDGASCGDGMACNGAETCRAGVCVPGMAPDCDDVDACTADSCVEPEGCRHMPIPDCCRDDSDCDDGDACTADSCRSNRCMNVGIPDCGSRDAGVGGDDSGPVGYDDGGGMGNRDAGLGRSDGGRGRGAGSGGGCGCSAPGTRSDGPFGAMVGLAFFGLIAWRRRRRGR